MKKVEERMLEAIAYGFNLTCGNTKVVHGTNGCVSVYLHNNKIALRNSLGRWLYSNRGFKTKTTKSRLIALGCNVFQKNYKWSVRTAYGVKPFVNDF